MRTRDVLVASVVLSALLPASCGREPQDPERRGPPASTGRAWWNEFNVRYEQRDAPEGRDALLALIDEMGRALDAADRPEPLLQATYVHALGKTLLDGTQAARALDDPSAVDADVARALAAARSVEGQRAAYLVYAWARFLQIRGRVAESAEVLERFQRAWPEEDPANVLAGARQVMLVQNLQVLGELDRAMEMVERGIRAFAEDEITCADLRGIRADLYLDLGLVREARADVEFVRRVADELGDSALRATALFLAADIDLATGDFESVKVAMDRASTAEWDAPTRALVDLYRAFGYVNEDPERALELFDLVLADPALPETWRAKVEMQVVRLGRRPEDVARVRDRMETPGGPGVEPQLASALSDAILAMFEAGQVTVEEVREQLAIQDAAFRSILDRWSRIPELPAGTSFFQYQERRNALRALIRLRMAIDPGQSGVEAAFGDLLRAQVHSTLATHDRAGAVSVADIRRDLLEPGCGILVYLPTPFGSHVFALDHDRLRHFALPPETDVKAAIGVLRRALWNGLESPRDRERERAVEEIERASRRIRSVVLPDDVAELVRGWKGLTVVGSGLWWNLPFEALVLDGDGGALLGEVVAIDNLGSLPFGVARARETKPLDATRVRLLATLAPDNADVDEVVRDGPEFGPDDVAELLGPKVAGSARVALEERFTPEAFLDAIAARPAGITHALAHGVLGPARRVYGLALAGRSLWPDEVRAHEARGLVWLSSCSIGRGAVRRGDDDLVDTLGGALLFAGAQTVVASRTDIVLGPHEALCRAFYVALAAGRSPAEALRSARVAVTRDAGRAARFAQSRIQVFGLGQRPVGR